MVLLSLQPILQNRAQSARWAGGPKATGATLSMKRVFSWLCGSLGCVRAWLGVYQAFSHNCCLSGRVPTLAKSAGRARLMLPVRLSGLIHSCFRYIGLFEGIPFILSISLYTLAAA